MKISKLSFIVVVLAIVLFSGCELIGDTVGDGVGDISGSGSGGTGGTITYYVFDTPTWIRGSWSEGTPGIDGRNWTFTATTVTFTDEFETVNMNTLGSDIGITITNESKTATTYEFNWSTFPYSFEDNFDGTLTFNDFIDYTKD